MTKHPKISILIPTYNNGQTLSQIIDDALAQLSSVIVVNDGSTDCTGEILKRYEGKIELVEYKKNRGKGYALSRGFDLAEQLGYTHVITIDSDGQHYASDIPLFLKAANENPDKNKITVRNCHEWKHPRSAIYTGAFYIL